MGGRFILGFGVSLVATGGPMYVVEVNHPAYRGVVGGKFFKCHEQKWATNELFLTKYQQCTTPSGFQAQFFHLEQPVVLQMLAVIIHGA